MAVFREFVRQFETGHAAEPDVENQAAELRAFCVCEECLRRRIRDRMDPLCPQKAAERSAKALVVIDDSDIRGGNSIQEADTSPRRVYPATAL